MKIKCFNAKNGDAIYIRNNEGINIFIDMGYPETYTRYISNDINVIDQCGEVIDLLIITHIDQDHISGAISFLRDIQSEKYSQSILKQVWHNSYRHLSVATKENSSKEDLYVVEEFLNKLSKLNSLISDATISAKQGSTLAGLIFGSGIEWNKDFSHGPIVGVNDVSIGNLKVTVLTPSNYILKNLKRYWKSELCKMKYDFAFGEEEVFDDAFEFYMLNETVLQNNSNSISSDSGECFHALLDNGVLVESEGDSSVTNASSIATIIENDSCRILLTSDAHDNDLYEILYEQSQNGINMEFDLVKLSHHGSRNNNSKWLELVSSKYYLISTDGSKHNHPDVEAIVNLILSNSKKDKILCFNSNLEIAREIDKEELKRRFNYSVIRPIEEWGIEIEL